jgi:hypothetical protein
MQWWIPGDIYMDQLTLAERRSRYVLSRMSTLGWTRGTHGTVIFVAASIIKKSAAKSGTRRIGDSKEKGTELLLHLSLLYHLSGTGKPSVSIDAHGMLSPLQSIQMIFERAACFRSPHQSVLSLLAALQTDIFAHSMKE